MFLEYMTEDRHLEYSFFVDNSELILCGSQAFFIEAIICLLQVLTFAGGISMISSLYEA